MDLNDFSNKWEFVSINTAAIGIFSLYNILAVLVALNMFIAMLNESYSQVTVSGVNKYCVLS